MSSASIIIATADRPQIVLDCIRCVREQIPPEVEILIVDAGRQAPVDEVALLALWPALRVIRATRRNAGLQRNEGVKQAKNPILIFLDDDCFVQPGWWPAIVSPLLQAPGANASAAGARGIGAVAGAVWCNPSPQFTSRRGGYVNLLGSPVQVTHRSVDAPRFVDWPMSTNMAIQKTVMEEIGGFPSVYGVYDEDVDLGLKIRKAGWALYFEPAAAVYHYYLKRGPRIPTKRTEFNAGRNRAILLVRNYGLSLRLILFFLTTPPWRTACAVGRILRWGGSQLGHVAAYVAGMVWGVWLGIRNPTKNDRL